MLCMYELFLCICLSLFYLKQKFRTKYGTGRVQPVLLNGQVLTPDNSYFQQTYLICRPTATFFFHHYRMSVIPTPETSDCFTLCSHECNFILRIGSVNILRLFKEDCMR